MSASFFSERDEESSEELLDASFFFLPVVGAHARLEAELSESEPDVEGGGLGLRFNL